jgi:hypothetical protein
MPTLFQAMPQKPYVATYDHRVSPRTFSPSPVLRATLSAFEGWAGTIHAILVLELVADLVDTVR